jgi:WD40 repeat protein
MFNLTAIAYRSSPLIIAEFDTNEKLGEFEKAGYEGLGRGPQVLEVNFSSASDLRLMAVAYQDGEIVSIDPWNQRQVGEFHLHAQILASSPDGYTLAAGDNEGVVWLFNFKTLRPIFKITSLEARIDAIVFSSNNLRVFDIRGTGCNVWEPPALARRNTAEDSSSDADDGWMSVGQVSFVPTFDADSCVTAMAHTHNGKHVFCAREDGSITIHEVQSGTECKSLMVHSNNVEIRTLQWCEKANLLISTDVSGRYVGTQLNGHVGGWGIIGTPIDRKTSGIISHTVTDPAISKILIATDTGQELVNLSPLSETTHTRFSNGSGRWMQHPSDSNRLLLLNGSRFHIFEWEGLKRLTPVAGIGIRSPKPFYHLEISNQ